jgi:hypothetical protein
VWAAPEAFEKQTFICYLAGRLGRYQSQKEAILTFNYLSLDVDVIQNKILKR